MILVFFYRSQVLKGIKSAERAIISFNQVKINDRRDFSCVRDNKLSEIIVTLQKWEEYLSIRCRFLSFT